MSTLSPSPLMIPELAITALPDDDIAIPMDNQWIVGSYSPDDFDINSRIFAINRGDQS